MIKYKLQTQQFSNIQIQEDIYYRIGLNKVMMKIIIVKKQNFIKSTKTNNPTGFSGAESLPPIGNSFMYMETSSGNKGKNVFVSFERTDIIQVSNITFY